MFIDSIEISGLRNFKEEKKFSFINGKNLIFGLNGSGKTSILESIYILGYGKSFLNVRRDEIMNSESHRFFARSDVQNINGKIKINYLYEKDFSIILNGKKIGITQVVDYFFPVFFSSSNYTFYIENRSFTRKMINRFLYGIDKLFTDSLINYGKILKQKKTILKNRGDYSQLSVWNRMMSEKMFDIIKRRSEFIEKLNGKIVREKNSKDLNLKYITFLNHLDKNFSAKKIYLELENIKNREIESGRVLMGTHRDSVEIELKGRPLKYFSSGEKKINLIIIYLAYIEIFKELRKEYPVLLIDDFDVAMDRNNIKILFEKYPLMQVICTSVNSHKGFENLIGTGS